MHRGMLTALCALAACGSGDPETSPAEATSTYSVVGRIAATSRVIGQANVMLPRGRYLWLIDQSGEPFLHLIDLESGEVVLSAGRRGEGPGEFEFPTRLFPHPTSPGGVTVYDAQQRRFTEIALDEHLTTNVGRVVVLTRAPIPLQVGQVGSHYMGWLRDPEMRWVSFRLDETEPTLLPGPIVGPESAPLSERIKASANVTICANHDGSRFAALYGSAGRIELHDSGAAFVGLADAPDSTDGEFVPGAGGRVKWDRQRFYYAGCAATERFLFALYSGREEGLDRQLAYAGDRVHVFDWDGRQIGTLKLAVPVVEIAIDSAATSLYGSGAEGNVIYHFDIPPRIRVAGR